jgi:hypothetical protein
VALVNTVNNANAMNNDLSMLRALNTAVLDRTVFLGLDLGKRESHTAIVALERFETMPDYTDILRGIGPRTRYVVRQAERIDLGTSYSEVVKYVKQMVSKLLSRNVTCILIVDESGVGVPVVEMMREVSMGCRIIPYVITSGQHSSSSSVPRAELITKMQLMAERGELEIASGCKNGAELKYELVHLQLAGGGTRTGSSEHDDLALALALACWKAKVRGPSA